MATKATKRALLSSALALVVCVSMLIGTTFAWFTDSVVSEKNIIKSGNLDIELEYWNGSDWVDVEGASDVLTNELFEPGVTEVAYLRLANAGSLALKYQLGINVVSETKGVNANGDPFTLSDYIYFGVVENKNVGDFANREAAVAAVTSSAQKISKGYTKADAMASGDVLYLALVVYMPESVGNIANHDGVNVPKIELGLNVYATQKMAEEDSFGNNYDDGAFIPGDSAEKPDNGALVLNSSAESNVTVTVPADVLSDLGNEVTTLSIAASAPVLDNTNNTVTFSTLELVDQNGKEVDISNSTTKVTVTLPVGNVFVDGETVVIFHDGEYMATAIVDNGFISYQAEHFCEVVVSTIKAPVVEEDGTVKIGNAADLFGLAQNVNSGKNYYEGKTVVLTADIDLKDAEWTPIGSATLDHGFMGNFDGNGKTISNLSINNIKPDADGYAYAGLFGVTEGAAGAENYIKDLTIKNVTINTKGHIVSAAIAYPYYTTLSNITVCGDIAITGGDYTSGVLAYTRRCTTASNITIKGNAGSYITGGITVGGVISDIQMNGGLTANYSNFSASNLTITGDKNVGGISGIIGRQTLNGATVKNVVLESDDTRVGIVSGAFDGKPVINNATYSNVSGTTSLVGAPYGADSNGFVIVDGVECAGNVAAFKEQLATGTVNLAANIALNETITIAKGNNVVINLNGNTISGTLSGTGNQDLFLVKGTLTLNNGNVELTATQNQGWNAMSTIFDITDGGVVNLESVVADNKGGTDMNFVAHLNNWGTVTLNVNNSTLKATYVAVRVFNSGYDMNNVSITNSTLSTTGNAAFWVHNYTVADFGTQEKADAQAKLLNFNFENNTYVAKKAAFRLGMTNAEYYTADNSAVVSTADELIAALEAGLDVVFANDIKIEPANMSNAYGKTGINVKNGQTIDGNGYTLNIKGAGGTWDSGINTTGGVIKNITVTGSFRGIFINHTSSYSEKVVLDNVTLTGVTYTISCDQGLNQGLVATNCTFNGWTSFAKTLGEAEFIDCAFGEGNGYAYCRPYAPTTFNNCTFSEGYAVDTTRTTVNFVDCEC